MLWGLAHAVTASEQLLALLPALTALHHQTVLICAFDRVVRAHPKRKAPIVQSPLGFGCGGRLCDAPPDMTGAHWRLNAVMLQLLLFTKNGS
jgi:hypothetical protein